MTLIPQIRLHLVRPMLYSDRLLIQLDWLAQKSVKGLVRFLKYRIRILYMNHDLDHPKL